MSGYHLGRAAPARDSTARCHSEVPPLLPVILRSASDEVMSPDRSLAIYCDRRYASHRRALRVSAPATDGIGVTGRASAADKRLAALATIAHGQSGLGGR